MPGVIQQPTVQPRLEPPLLELRHKDEAIVIDAQSDRLLAAVEALLEQFAGLAGAKAEAAVTVDRNEGAQS